MIASLADIYEARITMELLDSAQRLPREARTGDAFLPAHEPDSYATSHTHVVPVDAERHADGRSMSACGFFIEASLVADRHVAPTCSACLRLWQQSLAQWDDVSRPLPPVRVRQQRPVTFMSIQSGRVL